MDTEHEAARSLGTKRYTDTDHEAALHILTVYMEQKEHCMHRTRLPCWQKIEENVPSSDSKKVRTQTP